GALESVPVSNTQIDGSITVNKVDENGKALAGATFALYRVEGRSTNFFTNLVNTVKNVFDSKAVSGARFVSEKTTGADGVAKFEHLAPGRYYVVETAAPEGYALNSTPSAVMNVMRGGGKQNNHTLTVENSKITQLLTFNKVDAAGNLRNGAEFVILSAKNADGSKATTPTLTTVDGNTWSFTAVHGVTYTLHESKTPAGYETIQDFTLKLETVNGKTAVAASAGIAAVGTTGFEFNVANAKQMTSVTVEKVWVNGGKTENSATIVLERAIAGGTKVDVETAALSKSTAWKHTFANLDKTDDDGNVYTYTVREEKAGSDYQVVITGNMNNGFVVTNTLKADTTIKLAKVWNDAAAVSARPESVTLIISGTKADGTSEELTRATLTTENTENWTVAREVAVAKYDASGAAYTGYSITELASTGYEVAVVANGSDYTVTNTLSATTSVKIAKIWLDEETTHGDVTVQLYRAITGEAEKAVGEPVTFAKDHEWKDLAKYDASGAEYTYTVKETSTHAGYEVLPVAGGLENGIYKYTITNRKTGTTALTIQKNWNDDDAKDTARQDITFTLQRKVVGDAAATTCGTLKVTAPSWTATAENLPKYNENGKLYTYSIVEQTIGGYESKIAAPVEKDGTLFFEVTNTRRGTHTIQGEKVWRDGNSAARPTSVTITLERYTLSDGKMVK
ncbi:MAG: Cna B-type domain-containing protein, partial [Pygmaiobacter sp.]